MAGAIMLAALFSCTGPGETPAAGGLDGYRSEAERHKIQVGAEQAALIEQRGGKVVGDYGAFKVMEVDNATLGAVASTPSVELRDEYNLVRLNAGVIDTTTPSAKALRGVTPPATGNQFHLIQFSGPIQPENYAALEATGVKIVTYIPNNAYLVYGDAGTLENLRTLTSRLQSIQWDGAYLNDYKLDPSVFSTETDAYSIQLIQDPEANKATLALIDAQQRRERVTQEALGYVDVVAFVDRATAFEIAKQQDVVSIQPYLAPRLRDERQDMIISGNITGNGPTGPGFLAWLGSKGFNQAQFTVSGFGVNLSDSGIDNGTQSPNHFGLYVAGDINGTSRIVYNRLEGTANSGSTIQGCDGHGNLNSHIIGGYSDLAGAPFADATGFHYGLGVAPWVKIGSSVIFDPGTFTSPNYENLESRAYRDGMRISSNSWGSSANTYTTDAQRYDALVRDAQPAAAAVPAPGNQEMVIVFAAGNGGSGANTVGSPSTGKNVITVGASENVQAFGAADLCGIGDTGADSLFDLISFSSRGPTSDGRKKPDIVAPGTHVSGGVAQTAAQHANPPGNPLGQANSCFDASGVCAGPGNNFFPLGQQWYTASSGTSHSTPAVAGAAALLRQYFINQGLPPPSPAMTKAYLMSSTRYMTGTGANDTLYSNNQGMGLMDLGVAFDGISRLIDDENPANLFTATGQTRSFTGVVSDSTKPFRVTLAWTDAPGSTTGSAWKNNLDLTVTINGNTYKGNVFTGANSVTGGTADASNNVESVFLPAGIEGPYTVTVTATNINSDGVPGNASALDQDFALLVYNQCASAPATPGGVAATPTGNNRIDLTWTANGAPSYNVYRSLTAGGPYTRVATVSSPSYSDVGVSGGTRYYYVVRALQCAESAKSVEVNAVAAGACTLPPTFAGLTSAANGAVSTCTNTLTWSAATPICSGTLGYSVYRSTTSGFTPGPANRIATGVTGTTFSDNLNLAQGTTYYYVVRAVETSGTATNEDSNTVQKSAAPTGALSPAIRYFDDFDANRPANASAYWIPSTIAGTAGTLNIVNGCRYQSATNAYRFGAAATTCGGTYPVSTQAQLLLGGNGSVAGINGFVVPASAQNARLTFNQWYSLETQWDGAWLTYSTTGATGTFSPVPDTATAGKPFITAGVYDNTLNNSNPVQRVWTGANTPANGSLRQVTVDLSALAGQTVWFAFRFLGDVTISQEGFYLDDVRVNVDSAASCTTNVPPPGPAVRYQIANLAPTANAGAATTFDVRALDALGAVATGYTGTASFTSSDAQAVLPGNATFVAGVASGRSITFGTVGSQSVTATDTVTPSITGTASTTVNPGAASRLAFSVQPSSSVAGAPIAPAVKVSVTDSFGNLVTSSTAAITLALGSNPGGGTLSGTTTVAAVNGVATFSDLSVDKVGTGYTLAASSTGLTGATSGTFNISAGADASLAFIVQPSNVVAGAAIAPAMQVAVLDAFGNRTSSSMVVTLFLSNNPGGSALIGTTSVAAVNGIATFSDVALNRVASGYELIAFAGGLSPATSNPFDVTPAAPYGVLFTQQPSDTVAGAPITPGVQVTVYDRFYNVATQATTAVTVSLAINPTGATLSGTRTVMAINGVATFPNLSVDRAGTAYTLAAGASGLYGEMSVGFNVAANAPSRLVFRTQPANGTAGAPLAPVTVAIEDGFGNLITGASGPITVALGSNPAGGTLAGTTTVSAVNGLATFANLSINKAGAGYTLAASTPGLASASSAAFNVTAGAPSALAFVVQPSNAASGASLNPAVVVAVQDSAGNTVTNASASIALSLGSNPAGGTLAGTTVVSAVNGVATFPNLSIDRVGAGYTLAASSGALNATSSAFNISAGAVAKLAFTAQPQSTTAGAALSPAVVVTLQDSAGNTVTGASGTVSLSLGGGAGGTLSGTASAPVVNGVATFANLRVNRAGTGYTLTAHAAGLADVTSAAFDVAPGAAASLAFSVQPSRTQAGAAINPAVQVTVLDALGNTVTGATTAITVALGSNPGGGTLAGTTTVAPVNGVATFADLSINKTGSSYTLAASAAGVTGATSASFRVTPGAASALAFMVQPSTTNSGASLNPAVAVAIQDSFGNTVTTASASIALTLGSNPAGGALAGATIVSAVNGVATFSNLSIAKAGAGYSLAASSAGLTGDTSSTFNVLPGNVARAVFTAQPQNTSAGASIGSVVVTLQDSAGNTVTSASSTVSLTLGGGAGGALSGTASAAAVNGVATFSNLSIARAGAGYALTARSSGVADAISASFDVSPGPAAALVFAAQPSRTQAGAAIGPVQVIIQDAFGNTVTGAAGAVSIALGNNAAGGTLSGTATANAVNGVASFGNLSIDRSGTGYTLVATSGALSAPSAAFDVMAGPPARLAFSAQPGNTQAGAAINAIQVTIQDALGNTVTGAAGNVTLSLGNNLANGTLAGVVSVNAVNGVATFSGLSIARAGTGYTLVASSGGLSTATSAAFDITVGPLAKLVFAAGPSNAAAGSVLGAVRVELQDALGNPLTGASNSVSLVLGGSGGTLGGTTTVAAVNGIATFSNLFINRAAAGYTLTAQAAGASDVTSPAFDISAGPAANLVFSVQPGNTRAGAVIAPALQVTIQDALGNTVTGATSRITLALGGGSAGASLSGTASANAVNGVATFADLSIRRAGNGYSLTASATGLTSATSSAFNITHGPAANIVFSAGPTTTVAGTVLQALKVELQDDQGNTVTSANDDITLSLSGTPSGATLGGTTTVAAVNGVATFSDLFINRAAGGYKLTATVAGLPDITSSTFAINPGPAAALAFTLQPSTARAGAAISPSIEVSILDALGNVVTGATDSITLALSGANGTLAGTKTVAAVNGVATFSGLSVDRSAAGYKLTASANGLTSATSAAFDVTVGPPARLVFLTGPANSAAGAALGPITVELQDAQGNPITDATDVTLTFGANPGGTLLGTVTVKAVNGVATFSDVSIRKAANGYSLVATASGFAAATSPAFNISAGPAAAFVLSNMAQSATAGDETTFSITAQDAYGNLANDYAGTAKVSSSDTTVAPFDVVFTNGQATGVKITFKTRGLRTVTVTDSNQASLTASATVNVTAFPQPTVSVTAPGTGETVSGTVTVTATGAVANGTTLTQITILVDGVVLGTGTDATTQVSWDTSKLTAGSAHTLTASITDSAGNVQTSTPVTVTIKHTGCGCGATGGFDAGALLLALVAARAMLGRKRRQAA